MPVLRLARGVLIVGIALSVKKGPRLESVSIQEEEEQVLIARSVTVVVTERRITTSGLPFLTQPDNKLVPSKNYA